MMKFSDFSIATMSGVEDVIDPPPDKDEKSEEKGDTIEDKEEDKSCLTTSVTDSDSASVTESWTLLEKEEENAPRVTIGKFLLIILMISCNIRLFLLRMVRHQSLVVLWKIFLTKLNRTTLNLQVCKMICMTSFVISNLLCLWYSRTPIIFRDRFWEHWDYQWWWMLDLPSPC